MSGCYPSWRRYCDTTVREAEPEHCQDKIRVSSFSEDALYKSIATGPEIEGIRQRKRAFCVSALRT